MAPSDESRLGYFGMNVQARRANRRDAGWWLTDCTERNRSVPPVYGTIFAELRTQTPFNHSERVVREGDCAEPMVTTWFPLYTETTTTYAPAISPDRPLEKIDTASHCSGPSEPPERTAEVMPSGHASVVITVDRRNIFIVVIDIPDWHGLVANKLTRALWLR
jgi:hypothetical protein